MYRDRTLQEVAEGAELSTRARALLHFLTLNFLEVLEPAVESCTLIETSTIAPLSQGRQRGSRQRVGTVVVELVLHALVVELPLVAVGAVNEHLVVDADTTSMLSSPSMIMPVSFIRQNFIFKK